MSERATRITKRSVDAIEANGTDFYVFDTDLTGFGIRVRASGAMSYVARYRAGFGRNAPVRRVTIARVGKITPEQARDAAKEIFAAVVQGGDPARDRAQVRKAASLGDLVGLYLEHVAATKKPKTLEQYRHVLVNYALPALGTRKAHDVAPADIGALHRSLRGKPITANRLCSAVSAMYSWALKTGVVVASRNPCVGIERYREEGRERYLRPEELARLSKALVEAEGEGIPWDELRSSASKHLRKPENRRTRIDAHSAGAIRLLLLTGARLREILHLKWEHVDFERGLLLLPDSKTGRKTIVLSVAALQVLASLPRRGDFVISGAHSDGADQKPRSDLKRPWALVTRHAGLDGLRIHDLRHSFASFGAGGGLGLPIVGQLLGHAHAATTQRYAHLDADPLRRAANAIGASIQAAMAPKEGST